MPRLAIDATSEDFTAIDKQNFRIERKLTDGKELSLRQGGSLLGRWPIEIVPDHPPTIAFSNPPGATPRAALRLDFRAADDYGVASAQAVIRRPEGAADETIELDLPLPGLNLKEAEAASYHDLTPHPWAGLPVEIRLVATDQLGQTGESDPVRTTLPEREFRHPVARAIIDQRKELAKDPQSANSVAEILEDLNSRPALFRDDSVVYLGLRVAQQRLRADRGKETIVTVSQLLWDTALRIEDGNLSLAERDLRRLQQKLQEALAKGAPDEEIERLMQELREALDRYLQAMAEEMRRRPPEEAKEPIDPSQVLTSRDLQQMLDRAREMARNGARDQARELLSQLQEMLENLRTAQPGQMQQGGSQAQQRMQQLQQLMQRQQQLLDRSFRARSKQGEAGKSDRNGQPRAGSQPGQQQGDQGEAGEMGDAGEMGEMGDAAGQQEALRRMLGEMMRQLGEGAGNIPEPFGRAERSMRDATGALGRGRPGEAIGPQTDALDQLQQAARDLAQQMQNQLGRSWGKPDGEIGATDRAGRDRTERDPLGRPVSNNGTYDRGDVKIPDENILQKSRRILDELRRRAGERTRPEIELDYIDRLLKRF